MLVWKVWWLDSVPTVFNYVRRVTRVALPGTTIWRARGATRARTKKGSQQMRKVRTTMATVSVAFHSCLA